MPRSDASSFRPAILASWRQRLVRLRRRLRETPTASDAWYWNMQARVMKFLLARYDGVSTSQYATPQSTPADPPPEMSLPSQLTFCASGTLAGLSSEAFALRASQSVRPIVERIR